MPAAVHALLISLSHPHSYTHTHCSSAPPTHRPRPRITPTPPIQLADFNFDGYTDVLMVSREGIWGWAQVRRANTAEWRCRLKCVWCVWVARLGPALPRHARAASPLPSPAARRFRHLPCPQVRHPGALPFSALVAALMVIMAAVFVTQQGFMQGGPGGGAKRRPLRSTERED